ncbi:MAG: type II CRISPR RNA-guided endonuclease Cas9 [Candidatus Azobacteroides sp.]|nr:type II CRISPR RNA-guided endonuclease Cas9 [Candidatus Azobacteroides sp.]
MKKILGLDLGTNSIGWALVEQDFDAKAGKILGMGSRIIPMSQEVLGNFDVGNSVSQTAERTGFRATRRLHERHLLRRERLHRVLNILGFLPEHYVNQIDFEKRLGQFLDDKEPKIAWKEVWNEQKNKNEFVFIFQNSFNEMLNDFKVNSLEIKIPYDWTIYYLRKKALSQKITKEELAWTILNFNQKRGYYQLRGEEEEENPNKLVEFHSLKIIDVVADEKPNSKGDIWYSLYLENGWVYRRSSKTPLFDWKDKVRDFIVTTDLNDDGTVKTDKEGSEKRFFRAPSEDDWTLLKKKTENDIEKYIQKYKTINGVDGTVGTYIYEALLQNPAQKIRGKLVRTIERKFYKEELIAILKKQIELQPELFTEDLYNDCIRELYRSNKEHQTVLSKRNCFVHLFVNDIIFYQRPLRSQKSSIGNCSLEYRKHKNKDRNEVTEYLKVVSKSNPLYQEFRLWQWLFNLKIFRRDDDTDVTEQFITNVFDKEKLFDFLNNRKEIDQKALLKYFKLTEKTHRWNYVEDKIYPCNETGTQIKTRLSKVENIPADFLTPEIEQKLWHIIYSVTDKNEFEKALKTFANRHHLDEVSFVENFKKFPPFKREYGSFSEKAIKKLLPFMRVGKYWNWEIIDAKTKDRISKILTGEYDETIKNRVREKAIYLGSENDFQGLQLWLAQYIVYDRHSEANITDKWNTVADLEKYLEEFKQHSLRNPIVEQVITETLRVVRDIWKKHGDFSEIHIELGREMKNTADERKRLTNIVTENENTNLRIKALIMELKEYPDVENVRPYSPIQQEILKIYEEYAVNNIEENDTEREFIQKISKTAQPSKSELQRYKLWLEQKYRSPYTGQMIPLGKLFTDEYQIEHIIPQSRYFDDSLNNKVICEAAVNQLKDKCLGLEFIKRFHGQIVDLGLGKSVKIFEEVAYQDFVKQHYAKNYKKRNNLLLEDVPEKMIERQLNDTRYISKFVSQLLSNIVRADKDDDGVNSKNILPGNGKITTTLKQDWGLNDIWNDLILQRFERMNMLTNSTAFTAWNEQYQKFLPTIPLEFSKGFQKKRIDHRHHAMDALVIACATRDHINLLNNQSAKSEVSRYDLQNKLRNKERNETIGKDVFTEFKKPWNNFTVDARNELEKTVVSFKQNLRVINKTANKYQAYKNGKKVFNPQTKGDSWAIRKPLHKDTVFAKILLRKIKTVRLSEALKNWEMIIDKELKKEIKRLINTYGGAFKIDVINKYFKDRKYLFNEVDISKVEIYYFETENAAVRKLLDTSFTEKIIKESVTDSGIQKILLNHLWAKENKPELAFSPEGIEEMNKNIVQLNDGKFHQSINKVRVYEPIGNKFQVGTTGNKKDKYVEAAKGTNLFFAIYEDENGNRSYETIPLNIVIERLKQGLNAVPERNEKEHHLLFQLSPNDLVYVPTEDEKENICAIDWESLDKEQLKRIYKIVSFTNSRLYAISANVATTIVNKVEFTQLNKIEFIDEKKHCVKLNIDRLGNISL